jgi:hypothetical protein
MDKTPAFQFYPADWLNDIKLQSCSLEAQGLLINLMCLMHQSEKYGYLLINEVIPPDKEVARLLRLHHKTYHTKLIELLNKGVLYQEESGVIFCKRMVKDEQIRQIRREAGKLGGSPLLKQAVKQNIEQKPTPSSSSSSSSSSPSNIKIAIPLKDSSLFYITENDIKEWQLVFPRVNIEEELKKIRLWNLDNPQKQKTRRGIKSHIFKWLTFAQDNQRGPMPEETKQAFLNIGIGRNPNEAGS